MNTTTKWGSLAALIVAFVFVAACDRTVTYVEENPAPANCFACHSDVNTALTAAEGQWANSVHASGRNVNRNSSTCSGCHTSEGFVRRVNGEAAMTIDNPTAIHCFTCHAPHTNGNLTLRITAAQKLKNGQSYDLKSANICVACHQARNNVNTYVAQDTVTLSDRWGPHHSVQGDMLLGTNGYEYKGFEYEQTFHKGATEDGCLDCHFKVPNSYFLGGHSLNMAYTVEGVESFNTLACVECHSDMESATDFNRDNVQTDVEDLVAQLDTLLKNANLLVYYPEDDDWLPPARKILSRSEPGDSAGAIWNYFMGKEDRSEGIHNPGYIKGLLESAIEFMQPTPNSATPTVAAGGNQGTAH
jgi:formate-dependent nitrite reductase cytochrome c552 subunit